VIGGDIKSVISLRAIAATVTDRVHVLSEAVVLPTARTI
jgi:hypothetical protein